MPLDEENTLQKIRATTPFYRSPGAVAVGDGKTVEMVDPNQKVSSAFITTGFGSFGQKLELDKKGDGLAAASLVDPIAFSSPAVVKFDPDSKTPEKRNRFRLYAMVTLVVVVAVIGMGARVKSAETQGMAYRETLGIRETLEQLVGKAVFKDSSSPYHKALTWVTHKDPQQMLPSDARFQQRFAAAVFYYSTSTKGPWSGGCAEAVTEEERSFFRCVFTFWHEDMNMVQDIETVRWLNERDECSWYGVDCDEFGQVRQLRFPHYNHMSGTVPDLLLLFPSLQILVIKNQLLEGSIPESLFHLQHLRALDLSNNTLTGTIPEAVFKESAIERLILSHNQISGTLSSSVALLTDLKTLTLFNNKMQGSLPTEIGLVRNLQFFRVGRNNFNGTLPTELGNLQELNDLAVHKMNLTGTIPTEIGNMKGLQMLRLGGNTLTGRIPEELYTIPHMNLMFFQENKLEGTLSSAIGNFQKLMLVHLYGNSFTGTIPWELGMSPILRELQLQGNHWVGSVPDLLCQRGSEFQLARIVAECAEDSGASIAANPCSCCTECCSNGGRSCVKKNPSGRLDYINDEDYFLLNPL